MFAYRTVPHLPRWGAVLFQQSRALSHPLLCTVAARRGTRPDDWPTRLDMDQLFSLRAGETKQAVHNSWSNGRLCHRGSKYSALFPQGEVPAESLGCLLTSLPCFSVPFFPHAAVNHFLCAGHEGVSVMSYTWSPA